MIFLETNIYVLYGKYLGQSVTLIAHYLINCTKWRNIIEYINTFITKCENFQTIINTNLTLKQKALSIFAGNFLKTI